MQLKRQSEIAFGILVACARQPGELLRTQQLVAEIGTTKAHAYQVIALLVRHGLIHAERGRIGGIRIAMDPNHISLFDVLSITQPEMASQKGEYEAGAHPDGAEIINKLVAAADMFFFRLLERFTIADLIKSQPPVKIHCFDCNVMGAQSPVEDEDDLSTR